MQLLDLIKLFRSEVDDTAEPYLWSDDEAIEYANDAQNEACRRSRLIIDSSTAAICQIAVVANTATYALDPRVLFIRRARLTGLLPLKRKNVQDMDNCNPSWEDASSTTPTAFITDFETGKIRLYPTPNAAFTLNLMVVRTPLAEMNDDRETPEINARYHRSLRFWMMYRAYGKQDTQANDPKKSIEALTLFEQEFGKKSSAIDETWIEREQTEMDGTF